jgi:RNA polymerase sigma-70 factor, ECF subfamily
MEALPNPSLRAVDDLALIRRVAERRPEALAELYDRYAPLLLGVARRIVGAGFEAEEVLQETLLHAWGQTAGYDPARSSVSTWLVLAARSRALDRLRARRARGPGPTEPGPPARTGQPEETGLRAERRQRVRAVLDALPDEQRQILDLAFWQGLSQGEIAARTGAPLETVQARALAALRSVRQALRDDIRELM